MPIKNYTTSIDVGKTVGQIQKTLVAAGAKAILSEFGDDGVMESVSFEIEGPNGNIRYKLPANIDGVCCVLDRQRVTPKYRGRDQASRVAWRIIKDWIEAQMALIESEMVDAKQVFLPYMIIRGGRTLYESIEEEGFKLLGSGE